MSLAATLGGVGSALSGVAAIGSLFAGDGGGSQARAFEHNAQLQKDFAQHGLRWRVEDAKRAGIHPLYALGAQVSPYSPSQYIPGDSRSPLPDLGQVGQDIGRAIDATRTPPERVDARLEALSLKRAELENDLLSSQIAQINSSMSPGLPSGRSQLIPGQADIERMGVMVKPSATHVAEVPMEQTKSFPGRPWQDPASVSDVGFVRTADGGFAPVPSKDAKERMEDMIVPEAMWALRNHLLPSLDGATGRPPSQWLPDGAYNWKYDGARQAWYPVFHRPGSKPSVGVFWPKGSDESTWSGRPYFGQSRRGSYW